MMEKNMLSVDREYKEKASMFMQKSAGEERAGLQRVRLRTWGIRGAIVLCLVAGLVYGSKKMMYAFAHEGTDDAFIEGTVVPISSELKGKVTKVLVADNQLVKAGEPLVEISADDYANLVQSRQDAVSRLAAEQQETHALIKEKTMTLARARADLDAAETGAALAEKDLKRSTELRKKEVISQSQYDQAESRSKDAAARKEAAGASAAEIEAAIEALKARLTTQTFRIREAGTALKLAKLDLGRTTITAPIDGRVAKKSVDEGKYVQPGQPFLAIVQDGKLWVVANFKETQLARMRPGQPVDISVDAYPGVLFRGHVDSFQPGTGAVFSLLPPQNATGNFVKVVQRVPVKIVIDSAPDDLHPLRPGLSVYPSVAVKGAVRSEHTAND
jgi:membrane fusion protein (multidrug efflux system)